MRFRWPLILLFLAAGAAPRLAGASEPPPSEKKPHPDVHKNHVRKASADYLTSFRRITWHYDFATASELARATGRPMFVIFCRAGSIDDPLTGKPKCAS
jgi:hypothetical protein